VFFDAAQYIDLPAEQRGLGLVFQSFALWPHRTVFDNVAYGLKLRGVGKDEIGKRVEASLKQIGLAHLADRYPPQLSGGQQQRMALARATVYQPPLILLDEPLSNLDAKLREESRLWLRALITSLNVSALWVTHDQIEAMAVADRITLLNAGAVEQEGTPDALYNKPASLFSAEFMGSNNRIIGILTNKPGTEVEIDVGGYQLIGQDHTTATSGEPVTAVIRLERLRIADTLGPNRIPMNLSAQVYLGERWELVFTRDDISVRTYAPARVRPGTYYVEFPPADLWVY